MLSLTCLIKKKAVLFFLVCYFPVHVLPSADLAAGGAFLSEKISDQPHDDAEKEQQDSFKKDLCFLGLAAGACISSFVGGLLLNKSEKKSSDEPALQQHELDVVSIITRLKTVSARLSKYDPAGYNVSAQNSALRDYDVATLAAELDIARAQLSDLSQHQPLLQENNMDESFSLSDYTVDDDSV